MRAEVRHYLAFEFTGNREKFVYRVTEEVKEEVRERLLKTDWRVEGPVIEFEDVAGRMIAVNAWYVRRCQALFEVSKV